jgi:hypothetical protein
MCTMTNDKDSTDSDQPGQVGQEEAKRILALLEEAIVKSRRSRRDIERKLGWSQGYLGSLLRGRITLKVWHVFALSRELGLEPLTFFLTVAPPRDPKWILIQLGIPIPPEPKEPPPPKRPTTPMDRDELELLVKTLLHQELESAGLLDIEREPYSEDNFDQDLELDPEPAHSK